MREFSSLGTYLKEKRIQNELTQHELSSTLKLHSQFVSNWERGLCAPPSHSFEKLIEKLKINREELVDAMLEDSKSVIESKVYPKKRLKQKSA